MEMLCTFVLTFSNSLLCCLITQFRLLIFIIGFMAIVADIFNSYAFFILKPVCTTTIIAYSLSYRNIILNKYPLQISIGLFFCLLGDSFLLLETFFTYGLVSFLIAHLIFLLLSLSRVAMET